MRITEVRVWQENLELSRPYTIAYRTIAAVRNIFVALQLENGQWGLGAGSPAPFVTGEELAPSLARLQEWLPDQLTGRSILTINGLIREVEAALPAAPAARAAADIALHDALGQFLGISLTDWFGRVHPALPTSITVGIKDLTETLAEAEEQYGLGFRAFKIKTGQDVERDVAVCHHLRERWGQEIALRVDANQGYNLAQLRTFFARTADLNIELIEQPLPTGEYEQLRSLPNTDRLRCMADEDLHNAADAIHLTSPPPPYGIYNIKLMKCGGLSAAHSIAQIADNSGTQLMWGCNDESIISITAALHLALACPATRYLDLDGSLDLARDLVSGGFRLENGLMYPAPGPGLGVRPLVPLG